MTSVNRHTSYFEIETTRKTFWPNSLSLSYASKKQASAILQKIRPNLTLSCDSKKQASAILQKIRPNLTLNTVSRVSNIHSPLKKKLTYFLTPVLLPLTFSIDTIWKTLHLTSSIVKQPKNLVQCMSNSLKNSGDQENTLQFEDLDGSDKETNETKNVMLDSSDKSSLRAVLPEIMHEFSAASIVIPKKTDSNFKKLFKVLFGAIGILTISAVIAPIVTATALTMIALYTTLKLLEVTTYLFDKPKDALELSIFDQLNTKKDYSNTNLGTLIETSSIPYVRGTKVFE